MTIYWDEAGQVNTAATAKAPMLDLSALAGLPVCLAADGTLAPSGDVAWSDEGVRTLADLVPVGLCPPADGAGSVAYRMYRGLALAAHRPLFEFQRLRYDLTILCGDGGGEPVRTFGHTHPPGYGEVYQVLAGVACFLLEWRDPPRCVAVTAEQGQAAYIPPGYGHVTVNAGPGSLALANLVSVEFDSCYDWYRERGGPAFHPVRTAGGPAWVANSRCLQLPQLERALAAQSEWSFACKSLYQAFLAAPERFAFLQGAG